LEVGLELILQRRRNPVRVALRAKRRGLLVRKPGQARSNPSLMELPDSLTGGNQRNGQCREASAASFFAMT
jgi:hypothetical protein